MDKKKAFLLIQSVLCILIALLLAVFALIIYFKGVAAKAADPTAWIYSRELAGKYILPMLPLFAVTLIMALAGIFMGIRDEKQDLPVKDVEMKKNTSEGESVKRGKDKIIRLVILAVALIFIVIGILNGSARDVLFKAVTICTECVGLG